MPPQTVMRAFTGAQVPEAERLLAAQVISMHGRKLEEDDWSRVYCQAKGIPPQTWSNLNIDVMHGTLGVEHKMLCTGLASPSSLRGRRKMHPAATRALRIDPSQRDPNKVMADVLNQYRALIAARREMLGGRNADLRTGWLLWKRDLSEFLYFEEAMVAPDPSEFTAEWNTIKQGGSRKASTNLWIYEKSTGIKRYSLTTSAGIKLQPYFDIPGKGVSDVYEFDLNARSVGQNSVLTWVTSTTKTALGDLFGGDPRALSDAIRQSAEGEAARLEAEGQRAERVELSRDALQALRDHFPGATDDERLQAFIEVNSA